MTQPTQNEQDQIEWEWEYEYDESEREDFYVPLIFHSAAINWRSKGAQRRVARKSKRPGNQKSTIDNDHDLDPTTLDPDAPSRRQTEGYAPRRKRRKRAVRNPNDGYYQAERIRQEREAAREDVAIEDAQGDRNHVQILDLHEPNPLVSFRGRWYSCQWGHQIGTSMMFAEKNEDNEAFREAAERFDQSMSDFNIIALSDSNLIAEEKSLQYRKEIPQAPMNAGKEMSFQPSNGHTIGDISNSPVPSVPSATSAPSVPSVSPIPTMNLSNGTPGQLMTPSSQLEPSLPADLRTLQSSFLTKLKVVKQQKGETDGDLVHDSYRFSRPIVTPLDHTPGSLEEMRANSNFNYPQSNQVHSPTPRGPGRPRSFPSYRQRPTSSLARAVSEDPGEGYSITPTQVEITGRGDMRTRMPMDEVDGDVVMGEAFADQ